VGLWVIDIKTKPKIEQRLQKAQELDGDAKELTI
jgi:hypothetical protein